MSTILVTGASGFVGSHLVPAVLDAGHRIVALARSQASGEKVLARLSAAQRLAVEIRTGDVTRRDTLPAALAGVDAVLHLVAIPRDWSGGQELRLVNTEGTRNLVAAAQAAGVRRFVHQGALGVTDDPNLHYASSKAKAEAVVAASDLEWTILKPSILWGERDGFFNVIADLVRISPGVVPIPGGASSRYQPLWIGDLARIVAHLVGDPATAGRAYELGGPRYWTYAEMVREVLRGMGSRRALVPVPQPLIKLVAGTSETVRLPFPVATDQLRQLAFDNITAVDGLQRSFGWEPRSMDGNLGYLRRKLRDQEPAAA
jgi:NADH dehydrogenase